MTPDTLAAIGGRVLLAALFVLAGLAKALGPAPFREHMAQQRVPGLLIYPVILLELGGGLMLLCGVQTRLAAYGLAGFCVLTAVVFHRELSNKAERTLFLKDLAIAGGLLALASAGA